MGDPAFEAWVLSARNVTCIQVAERENWFLYKGVDRCGPCPKCGGRDRFSIHTTMNKWNCRQCGKGGNDSISLIQHMFDIDFKQAVGWLSNQDQPTPVSEEELRRRREAARAERIRQESVAQSLRERAMRDAMEIWRRREPVRGSMVEAYYELRNLRCSPNEKVIAFLPDEPYVFDRGPKAHERWVRIHSGPCQLAVIHRPDNKFGGVHRTWLDLSKPKGKAELFDPDKGEPLSAKMTRGSKKGGAIRLFTPETYSRMCAGEGIETTETARGHSFELDTAYWCLVDLGNIGGRTAMIDGRRKHDEPDINDRDAFVPPECVRDYRIIGDGDSNARGTRNTLTRGGRRAMLLRPGLRSSIAWAGGGVDLNDLVFKPEMEAADP